MSSRREFMTLLGGAAAWPLATRAQQPAKLPMIGFLGSSTPSIQGQWVAAFVQRLRELGWIEGRNAAIEVRWAEARPERVAEIAAEFVRLKVDIIVTLGAAVVAAKQATSVIPIVFVASDPLGTGLIASLARPSGNVTGLSLQAPDLASKRLEVLREVLPGLRLLAILTDVDYAAAVLEMEEVQAVARMLSLEVTKFEIRRGKDIVPVFEALNGRAEALYVCVGPVLNAHRVSVNTLANVARLPTIAASREFVEAGSLMSYGPDFRDQFRRAADYVDKILRGAKPGELPVEQPTKFNLIINLTTAKALGIEVPASLLARADEVIE